MRLSNFEVSDGFRSGLDLKEREGLDRELGWVDTADWLYPERLEDMESEGVW